MMKVLWMSDSPTVPSGFGNVSRFVCAGLAARGHDVSIVGWQARGRPEPWEGCTLYPTRLDTFGADVLLGYLQRLRPDVLVTLADVWWLTYIANPTIAGFLRAARIPWALYYPIDGDLGGGRLPPSWVGILDRVDIPIAMSQYGRDVTLANGVRPFYIPHGVETSIFRPPDDKDAAKRAMGYEDRFVVLCDARNQPRKLLPRLLDIVNRFTRDRDDVLLHLHCDPHDPAARSSDYCYDVTADVALLRLGDRVRFTDGMSIEGGLPIERLAAIYQAADVHLLASWGEGFGLPSLQAAAAGVVPMAIDYTASQELTRGHGASLRVAAYVPDQFGLRRGLVDEDDAVDQLSRLHADRTLLAAHSRASRTFAEAYDWGRILPLWDAVLVQEVARARQRMDQQAPTSTFRIDAAGRAARTDGGDPSFIEALSAAIGLPGGATATIKVVESEAGRLAANVLRDASLLAGQELTIPVALPPVDHALADHRIPGCVHVASSADAAFVWRLARVFPGITVWSSWPVELGTSPFTDEPIRPTVIAPSSPQWRKQLAMTVLAVDLAGAAPQLPATAAELAVPSIGRSDVEVQQSLFPSLSVAPGDVSTAVRLARDLLIDPLRARAALPLAPQRMPPGRVASAQATGIGVPV